MFDGWIGDRVVTILTSGDLETSDSGDELMTITGLAGEEGIITGTEIILEGGGDCDLVPFEGIEVGGEDFGGGMVFDLGVFEVEWGEVVFEGWGDFALGLFAGVEGEESVFEGEGFFDVGVCEGDDLAFACLE